MVKELVTMTAAAAKAIKDKTAQIDGAIALRLRIVSGGCSGNEYQMEPVKDGADTAADDRFERDGAVLFVPKMDVFKIIGTEIDYESNQMSSGFTFKNPNVTSECGCGESFSVEELPPIKPRQP